MYKNQLQELAQRSCFNLPAYSCIREGPDHAPRFKATVNFNGEVFESPNFCTTLRQAEHAAAEVALNTLSKSGPSRTLAAKILDETGVCKNLLQEAAQRAGVSLPIYTTIKGGPGHLPVFKCLVELAGRVFAGEPAKTKKQAEKNAAMAAWLVVKQWTQAPSNTGSESHDENCNSGTITLYRGDERTQNTSPRVQASHRRHGGRSRVRVVNVRERDQMSREGSPAGHFRFGGSSSSSPSRDVGCKDGMFLFNRQSYVGMGDSPRGFQRSPPPPYYGGDSPGLSGHDVYGTGVVGGSSSGDRVLPLPWQHHPPPSQSQRLSRLSLQSHSDRFELRRPLLEELDTLHGEGDDDWRGGIPLSGVDNSSPHLVSNVHTTPINKRAVFHSQSERFELKPSLLEELYHNNEEEWWLRGELTQPVTLLERARSGMRRDVESGAYLGSVSQVTGFNDDFGSLGSGYNRDANTSRGYLGGITQQVIYNEPSKLLSSFSDLKDDLDMGRGTSFTDTSCFGDRSSAYSLSNHDSDRSASSFMGGFSLGTVKKFHSLNDGPEAVHSAYPKRVVSSFIDDECGASSSSSLLWSQPAQILTSHPTAIAQSLGIRPAPPVRVRQMVTVSSAPPLAPPHQRAIESASSRSSSFYQHAPEVSSNGSDAAALLFSQLRI